MFSKGFEGFMTVIVLLAALGFISVLYWGGSGIVWLIEHVHFS